MAKNNRREAIKHLKEFLQKNFPNCQAFNTRNYAGDYMETVYKQDGITVDYCESWEYLEIFGLTESEYYKLIIKGSLHQLKTFRIKRDRRSKDGE